jgi:hypothetical protein
MSMPDVHYAGDTFEFRVSVPDYPPSEGWSLQYRFVPRFTSPVQAPITVVATVDGDEYVLFQSPAQTAIWVPGAYSWARWVVKAGARQVLDDLESRGQLQVLPDPAQAGAGYDNRTLAQKALDEARAALADVRSGNFGVKRYAIGGREMEFHTVGEAVKVVRYWEQQVAAEDAAARLALGLQTGRTVRVRF